ncbi:Dabb family protein [Roseospira visakhapatnamensis]|uniref:Quinol monooxygenase YgiN n=1 Tax=Roseospira visakhapatnamensis TaxID=390880 RepID=A0A7W6RB37_9PROT|nr:Dabb family protein [Roseospira visakhapatnamensis]MBB4265207.1 quinol monooxygenase YgiN [Roseospira visakhapatnamensis]
MIRHVVLFSLKHPDNLEQAREGLQRLADIPEARDLEVAVNLKTDRFDNQVDLIVHAIFDDAAALDAYKHHPIYQDAIATVRPLRDMRVAADFVSTLGPPPCGCPGAGDRGPVLPRPD